MARNPELEALIEQAARNIKTLELLVGIEGRASLEDLRFRIQRLREAYTQETDSLTRQVLRRAIERRSGMERRRREREAASSRSPH